MFSDSLNQIAERHPLWTLALVLRVPLIVVTGYALMVSDWLVEDVAFEAVRYVALDKPYQLYLIAPLLLLAGLAVRFCGETMIDLVAPALRYVGGISGFLVWTLPGLLAALIGISTGAQFVNVAFDKTNFGAADLGFLGVYEPAAIAGIVYALIGVVAGAVPTRWVVSIGGGFSPIDRFLNSTALTYAIAVGLLAAAIAVFVPFADWTDPVPAQFVGSFGVIALWAFAAVMYFSPLALLAHLIRTPVLMLLTAAALAFSVLNLNDNHEFRTVTAPDGRMYFQEELSLKDWLKARENVDLYNYANYPVFIVAAEGGGLRAAYFTNRVLRTLQTVCPTFALHTIAISGVSGGSVGAASFVAQTAGEVAPPDSTQPCRVAETAPPVTPQQPLQPFDDDLQTVYGEDHLATLLAATLFPDALQRLLPKSISEFDRARAIDCSFERSLAQSANGMGHPCSNKSLRLGDLYSAGPSSIDLPHLFLNTASVTTGAQIPVVTHTIRYRDIRTPILFSGTETIQSLANRSNTKPIRNPLDIPLTTAAFLSARFPFVLPPARFPAIKQSNVRATNERLIDGGLFEASAVWFSEQIVRSLLNDRQEYLDGAARRAAAQQHSSALNGRTRSQSPLPADRFVEAMKRVQFHVIVIRSTPCRSTDPLSTEGVGECPEDFEPDPQLDGFAELGSPPRTLLNARLARGHDAQQSLVAYSKDHRDQISVSDIRFINHESVHIPLSWSLSRESRRQMDKAVARIFETYWPKAGFRRPGSYLTPQGVRRGGELTDLTSTDGFETMVFVLCNTAPAGDFQTSIPLSAKHITDARVQAEIDRVRLCHTNLVEPEPLPQLPEVDNCEGCVAKP